MATEIPPTTIPTNSTFADCLRIQWRVLHALLMRELITRFGRENLGVLWLVGEPMIFTLGVAALWSAAGLTHSGSIPIVAFAVTGYSSVLMWRNSASRSAEGIGANKQLLYHRSVRVMDVLLSRTALEVGGATGSFIFLSCLFVFIGWMPVPRDFLLIVEGWLMLAWFGASLGLLIGSGAALSDIVHRLWHPLAYILFPMSGAAFMVDWLPSRLQSLVLYLPMVHGIEVLRRGFFGNVVATHYDIGYMAKCCLVLTLLALYLVRIASKRVEL